jgi:hypothetical protein
LPSPGYRHSRSGQVFGLCRKKKQVTLGLIRSVYRLPLPNSGLAYFPGYFVKNQRN